MKNSASDGQEHVRLGHEYVLSKKHVAVIGLTYPFRGGIAHYSSLFVRSLREKHHVSFITLRRQYPKFLFPGVSQFDYSDRILTEDNEPLIDSMNPFTWVKTARLLNRRNPDLIIFQWWHPFFSFAFGTIVRLLKKPLRQKVCFLCHNVLPHEPNPLQEFLARYSFIPSRFFIVHSSQDLNDLLRLHPNAIAKQGFHPTYSEFASFASSNRDEARKKLDLSKSRNVLLFFGLIREYKGLKYLIEAMALLPERLDCYLIIAGEFYADKRSYLDQIERTGLAHRIRTVDRYIANEDVADYFLATNVVVLPYISATQSGIVQIAFGLGTPVITTDVGGLPEAVDDGKTGYIVPPANSEQLAAAITRFFDEDAESRFRATIDGQIDRFGWGREIDLIEEFLISSDKAKL